MKPVPQATHLAGNNSKWLLVAEPHHTHTHGTEVYFYASASPRPAASLNDVPTDAVRVLLSFLTLSDHEKVSVTSRHWQQMIQGASHLYVDDHRGAFVDDACTIWSSWDETRMLGEVKLRRLLRHYPNLQVLQLRGISPVRDSLFAIINQGPCARTLRSLTLHGASISYWCNAPLMLPQLNELALMSGHFRASLKQLLAGVPNLNKLMISQCSAIRDEQIRDLAISHGDTLKDLSFHQCLRLRSPSFGFRNLKKLSLMGCFALGRLPDFNCPQLRYLDLSFSFRLAYESLNEALASCWIHLDTVKLVKCASLLELKIDSPTMTHLDISHCNLLYDVRLVCPRLAHLRVTACLSLESLLLSARELHNLDLYGLPISRLQVVAERLQFINLSNCRRLWDCSIHCPDLHEANLRGCRKVALRFCKDIRNVTISKWTAVHLLPC